MDIVMQGGVTSGVVFPGALYELGQTFSFRRIGGTSAGAIAAALLAAAEYGREQLRLNGNSSATCQAPFETLQVLGDELAAPLSPTGNAQGARVLEGLFAPDDVTQGLYLAGRAALRGDQAGAGRALLAWTQTHGIFGRSAAALNAAGLGDVWRWADQGGPAPSLRPLVGRPLVWGALALLVLTVLGTALLSQWCPAWAASLGAVLAAGLLVGTGLGWHARRVWARVQAAVRAGQEDMQLGISAVQATLKTNRFGLASGYGSGEAHRLTPWLCRALRRLSGHSGVLTFGDLLSSGIELRLVTSCLSRQRPYRLPLTQRAQDTKNLYFRLDEWRAFFPEDVLACLVAGSERRFTTPDAAEPGPNSDSACTYTYFRLPPENALPVVVAVRLSMSFPLLFSAVPLHYIRYQDPKAEDGETLLVWSWRSGKPLARKQVQISPLLFSDGGLTSNFPLMLFDQPVPERPLLALRLQYRDKPQAPFLAGEERWQPDNQAIESAPQFAGALLDTARLWFDQTMLNLPGYAEQTVCITLVPGQGGLNLSMNANMIQVLLHKGQEGGLLLRKRFAPGSAEDWGEAALKAFRWRNVVAELGDLLLRYDGTYPPSKLRAVLNAMPKSRRNDDVGHTDQLFEPNNQTVTPAEAQALRALAETARLIELAQRDTADAIFPKPTQQPKREPRGLLRSRPFI